MTLPSLIGHYEKLVTLTKLRKAQSVLSQGIKLAELDNGDMCSWFDVEKVGNIMTVRGNYFMDKYIRPYYKILHSNGGSQANMKKYGYSKSSGVFTSLSGSTISSRYEQESFMSTDNMYFGFNLIDNKGFNIGAANNSPFLHLWLTVLVDVNGPTGPNKAGRDVFYMELLSENCRPAKVVGRTGSKSMGSSDGYKLHINTNSAINDCKKGSSGEGCFTKIIHDNWKIKEDYPW